MMALGVTFFEFLAMHTGGLALALTIDIAGVAFYLGMRR